MWIFCVRFDVCLYVCLLWLLFFVRLGVHRCVSSVCVLVCLAICPGPMQQCTLSLLYRCRLSILVFGYGTEVEQTVGEHLGSDLEIN